MRFKRMTPAQRRCYEALRALGSFMVTPGDARPLKALARRGLVRYRRIDGVRYAFLRETTVQARRRRKMKRDEGLYLPMNATGWIPAITEF